MTRTPQTAALDGEGEALFRVAPQILPLGGANPPDAAQREPLVITVHGKPITQGSKTKNRYGATYDDNAKTLKPWRDNVRTAALDMREATGHFCLEGPVAVQILFCFDRPAGHYGSGRNAHLLKDSAPAFPAGVRSGDIDKLQRSCFDSLTDARVWRDDCQVVHVEADKAWAGGRNALDFPGVRITVWSVTT